MAISFKGFLINEAEGKNTHLEHLEDEIFNRGAQGLRDAINFVLGLRNMLAGHGKAKVNVTVKWDGAPAIICGTDPETGKFFVGTKGVFNKDPKIMFTPAQIRKNYDGELAEKLIIALTNLSKLGIKEVIQGDWLYANSALKMVNIDGEQHVAFRPNTITYTVPVNSALAQKIMGSAMGIVFHTTYTGKTLATMKANFGANVNKYKKQSSVWVTDAYYKDETGSATMTEDETAQVTAFINLARHLFSQVEPKLINYIAKDVELKNTIKMYNNAKVRAGQPIGNVAEHVDGLIRFIEDKYQKEMDKLKTEKGKEGKRDKLEQVKSFIHNSRVQFQHIFEIQNMLTNAKSIILRKLQSVKGLGTFIETPDGYRVTSPEGFVAIDNISGKAVKLVDRLEFSRANLTVPKNWG